MENIQTMEKPVFTELLIKWIIIAIGCLLLLVPFLVDAAVPYIGNTFMYQQPDGDMVRITIEGNNYYAEQRTDNGSLVVFDSEKGGLCYARVNDAGDDLESTGELVTNQKIKMFNMLEKRENQPGLSPEMRKRKSLQKHQQYLQTSDFKAMMAPSADINLAPATGNIKGLTVLIKFPDHASDISRDQVDRFLNDLNYNEFGNAYSIRGFYKEASGDALDYTNLTTVFYTAKQPRSYYTDEAVQMPQRAQELIREALGWLRSNGFEFSQLSLDQGGNIRGLNFFYAGEAGSSWGKGLWPHMAQLSYPFCTGTVCAKMYQISPLGSELKIGTFAHETGHLLMGWNDLYDYDNSSYGSVSLFGLMGYGAVTPQGMLNPVPPNGYFRTTAGWTDVIELNPEINSNAPSGLLSLTSGSQELYRWSNPNDEDEAFYIEAIQKSGQYVTLPDEGLAIYHVDPTNGDRDDEWHPQVQLEHADGNRDPENMTNPGDSTDLYDGITYTTFNDSIPNSTSPYSHGTNSKWWSGISSGLEVNNISPAAPTINFDITGSDEEDDDSGNDSGETETFEGELRWFQSATMPWFELTETKNIEAILSAPANFSVKIQSYVNYGYYGFWQTVASGNGSISYSAEPGYYQIVVSSNWGSGAYTVVVSK